MEAFVLWHRIAPAAHEEEVDSSGDLAWLKYVRTAAEQRGATALGPVGGALAMVFDPLETEAAMNFALAMLDAAERSPDFTSTPRIAFGAALGELDFAPSDDGKTVLYIGAALDRAQLLSNRARAGELVLDTHAKEATQAAFLFHRTVGTGEASLRGHAVDREEPRVAECRRHFIHLMRPPTPESVTQAFEPLREDATAHGARAVVVRGEPGSGSRRAIAELEFSVRPSLVLRCVAVPSGLEPLGSLRAALLRAYGPGAARLARLSSLDLGSADALGRIARGEVVDLGQARTALAALLRACREPDTNKPWIVLDFDDVDESTLEIVGRIVREPRNDVLTLVHAYADAAVPSPLTKAPRLREIVVPTLRFDEVRVLVEKMLREPTGGDIARRVAATDAKTPLAAVECVRAWIASGDVVRRGRSFVFRVSPRVTTERASYADWATERVALLDADAGRALELIASSPAGLLPSDLESLAETDGFTAQTLERALTRLVDDRFVHASPLVEVDNPTLRALVRARMPAGRRADLALLIAGRHDAQAGFSRATLGHFLAEAGRSQVAAEVFLDAAQDAVENGHDRACIRLASAAVQTSPSPGVRARAATLLRGATLRMDAEGVASVDRQSVEVPVPSVESPARVVVSALRMRDFDKVEQFVDVAIAEGASLAAADRLRAIVCYLRGDRAETLASIARARGRNAPLGSRIRTEVFSALVEASAGRHRAALRILVAALADAREAGDMGAEAGVLHGLGLAFRWRGREDAAEAFLRRPLLREITPPS